MNRPSIRRIGLSKPQIIKNLKGLLTILLFCLVFSSPQVQAQDNKPDHTPYPAQPKIQKPRPPQPEQGANPQFERHTIILERACALDTFQASLRHMMADEVLKREPMRIGMQLKVEVRQEYLPSLATLPCVQETRPGWHDSPPPTLLEAQDPALIAELLHERSAGVSEEDTPPHLDMAMSATGQISGTVIAAFQERRFSSYHSCSDMLFASFFCYWTCIFIAEGGKVKKLQPLNIFFLTI